MHDWIVEPENKMTVYDARDLIPIFHHKYYRSGVSSLLTVKESAGTYFSAFTFEPFNPFYELINEMMGDLAAVGIYDYILKKLMYPKGFKFKASKIGPQVLTMDHLAIGFQICLVALAISAMIFALEIVSKYNENFIRNLKNFLSRKMLEVMKPKQKKFRANRTVNMK